MGKMKENLAGNSAKTRMDAATAAAILSWSENLTMPKSLLPVINTLREDAGNDEVGEALLASLERVQTALQPEKKRYRLRPERPKQLARIVLQAGDNAQIARIIISLSSRGHEDFETAIAVLLEGLDPAGLPAKTVQNILANTASHNHNIKTARIKLLQKVYAGLNAAKALKLLSATKDDQDQKALLLSIILKNGTIEEMEAALKIDPENTELARLLKRKGLVAEARKGITLALKK